MNANQRLDPTSPGYNLLPSLYAAVLKNSHHSPAFEMYQNHHIKQARCTWGGKHTHTKVRAHTYKQTYTCRKDCRSKEIRH